MLNIKFHLRKVIPPLNPDYRNYKLTESIVVFDKKREVQMIEESILTLRFYEDGNNMYACAWFGKPFGYIQTSAQMEIPDDEEVCSSALLSEKIFNQVFETESGYGFAFNDCWPQMMKLDMLNCLMYITGISSLDAIVAHP